MSNNYDYDMWDEYADARERAEPIYELGQVVVYSWPNGTIISAEDFLSGEEYEDEE